MPVLCYDALSDQTLELEQNKETARWARYANPSLKKDELAAWEFFPYAVPLSVNEAPFGKNTSFLESSPFQFAWDSVSLTLFQTCPRKYYLTIIHGWTNRRMPPPLSYGIFFHTCMETWHKLITSGMNKDQAQLRLLRLALLLGEHIAPGDTARTKETLARAVILYLDRFWDDPAETYILPSGKPAVELSFQLPFEEINGIPTYLCGHIDRVVTYQDDIYFSDFKTTKYGLDDRFFSNFSPSTQMSNYNLATQVILEKPAAGGIIDGIQLLVNHNRYLRRTLEMSAEQTEEHIRDVKTWLVSAEHCASEEYWPKNPESCSKYSGCHFRAICAMQPARREMYLKGDFIQRTWDCLIPR